MSHTGALPPPAAPVPHLAPGRMGIRLAVLSVAIGLAAINTGNNLLYVMLSLILGLAAVSAIVARLAMRTLSVRALLPSEAVCGEPMPITVEARGRFRWLPQTWIDVQVKGLDRAVGLSIPLSSRGGRGAATVRVRPGRRGVYSRLTLAAGTGYPLDLQLSRGSFTWEGDLVVLPRFDPIASLSQLSTEGRRPGDATAAREPGTGAELRQVRAYTWQDDARLMHWRATARAGRPMVRDLEHERERTLDLVLDTGAADSAAFEALVSRAAALLDLARRERIPFRLHAPGAPASGLPADAAGRFLAEVAPRAPGVSAAWAPPGGPGVIVLSCAG
ncbi:MAG: DUF58 domain-containing protein [Candidatus Polarisedimenticolia bacterium]